MFLQHKGLNFIFQKPKKKIMVTYFFKKRFAKIFGIGHFKNVHFLIGLPFIEKKMGFFGFFHFVSMTRWKNFMF